MGVSGEGGLHNLTSKYTVHAAVSSNCVNTCTSKAWILFHALVDILNKKDNTLFLSKCISKSIEFETQLSSNFFQ